MILGYEKVQMDLSQVTHSVMFYYTSLENAEDAPFTKTLRNTFVKGIEKPVRSVLMQFYQ
jgi:hypothetical protein